MKNSNFELKNKKVLITGSTGHVGKYIAYVLSQNKSQLILIDKEEKKLLMQKKVLSKFKNKITTYKCDFLKLNEKLNLFKKIKKDHKYIDTIINNAAFVGDSNLNGWVEKFEKQSLDTWRKCIEVNLTSIFEVCKELKSLLLKSKNPNIINISSIYGVLAPNFDLYQQSGTYNPAAYSVSKSGLIYLTKWLASEMSPKIRVNSISLGGIKRYQKKIFIKKYVNSTLLNRMGTEKDIIGAIIFLSTKMSEYITGQNLIIDGGKSII